MRKSRIIVSFVIAMLFLFVTAFPAMADATRVVTIGVDLTDEQEAFIINYFGVDLATAEVIYVNNQQERQYVGSWIPLEQIGNKTISSAYVQPTNSGGIQVKTANLTYVTGNMIASVLSTAGVKNCNVVAAAPFPVSGTGALTGVMIAYQQATGEPLDETKRELAVQEFTVTQQAAESIGENEALQLVNAVKMEVIQADVPADDTQQIEQIVDQVIANIEQKMMVNNGENNAVNANNGVINAENNAVNANNGVINAENNAVNANNGVINADNSVTNIDNSYTYINNGLSEEDRQMIIDLATEIARQDYEFDDVKETLQRVEDNLANETNISIVVNNSDETNVENNVQVDTPVTVDTNVQTDVNAQADANAQAEAEEDSILSNTNDDLIDAAYQSSTREEDIEAIEEAVQQEQEQQAAPAQDSPYDMSSVVEYYEAPAAETPAVPQDQQVPYEQDYVPEVPGMNEQIYVEETTPAAEPAYVPDTPVMDEQFYVQEEPAGNGPAYEEPVYQEPVFEEPVYQEPVFEEPVYQEPVFEEPVYQEPVFEEPVYQEPVFEEPVYQEPVFEEPVYQEPVFEEPVYQEPVFEEPVYQEPVFEEPVYQEPVIEEPIYQEPVIEEPVIEEPPYEEPAVEEAPQTMLLGGWTIAAGEAGYELPEEVKAAFESAAMFNLGMDYTPVTYLGSQVVAGMNYRILCTGTPVVPDAAEGLYVVTVYQDLEGNASITEVKELDLAELEETEEADLPATGLMGGWYAPETYEAGELPADAQAAFDAATMMLLGVDYVPADLLGTKVIAGTEYAILSYATTVTEQPESYFAVLFIAANADGTTQLMKVVPLDLADLGETFE